MVLKLKDFDLYILFMVDLESIVCILRWDANRDTSCENGCLRNGKPFNALCSVVVLILFTPE